MILESDRSETHSLWLSVVGVGTMLLLCVALCAKKRPKQPEPKISDASDSYSNLQFRQRIKDRKTAAGSNSASDSTSDNSNDGRSPTPKRRRRRRNKQAAKKRKRRPQESSSENKLTKANDDVRSDSDLSEGPKRIEDEREDADRAMEKANVRGGGYKTAKDVISDFSDDDDKEEDNKKADDHEITDNKPNIPLDSAAKPKVVDTKLDVVTEPDVKKESEDDVAAAKDKKTADKK